MSRGFVDISMPIKDWSVIINVMERNLEHMTADELHVFLTLLGMIKDELNNYLFNNRKEEVK
jgi:hypothetical protein